MIDDLNQKEFFFYVVVFAVVNIMWIYTMECGRLEGIISGMARCVNLLWNVALAELGDWMSWTFLRQMKSREQLFWSDLYKSIFA